MREIEKMLVEELADHIGIIVEHIKRAETVVEQLTQRSKDPLKAPEIIGANRDGDGGKVFDD